ncbi:MAG: uroporphyrinogen III methyltransferase/synthase [Myxococcota bacterium]
MSGFVSLVGAGPGDPGLLTRKGEERIRSAEVVVHDALVSPPIVAMASATAEVLHRRQIGDGSQEAITAYLVERGLEGRRVVRLKGGDPFVFGRGAEEAESLAAAGITFEIVPGVTAGIAAAAYAGIPLTHRAFASDVTFVTGHEDPSKPDSSIQWDRIVRSGGTLVVFMGVRRLPRVVEKLIEVGADAKTPVAVIQWGTTPMQRTVEGVLSNIVARIAEAGLDHPALVVIGKVVSLRDRLAWFDRRPLWGRRVLVTRARSQAPSLTAALRDVGAGVVGFPVLEFGPPSSTEALDRSIHDLQLGGLYDWVVFTSANAVIAFWDAVTARGLDLRCFSGTRIACVGPATAEALRARSINADLVPAQYSAEALVGALVTAGDIPAKRFLFPRAEVARNTVVEGLKKHGGVVDVVPVYATRKPDASVESAIQHVEVVDTITFTSPSAVRNLQAMLGDRSQELLTDRLRVAIGPITAQALEKAGLPAQIVAEESSVGGLVTAIVAAVETAEPATAD